MPQSGSEPRFGPELLRTGPKSGPRFGIAPELNRKSGSRFGRGAIVVNLVQTKLDPEPVIRQQRQQRREKSHCPGGAGRCNGDV